MGLANNLDDLGIAPSVAAAAIDNLHDGVTGWVVVSGKMLSGKDTAAPLILPALGFTSNVRIGYSDPMRVQYQEAIDILTGRTEPLGMLAIEVGLRMGLKYHHAMELVKLLHPVVADPDHGLTADDRTLLARTILQKLGSIWRCEDDPEYWSRRVTSSCIELIAAGRSVYLTGGRFEPDVRIPQQVGAKIVRLDISRDEQIRRLMGRDGLEADLEQLDHPSETALDDWPHFDVRVLNEGRSVEETVTEIAAKLASQKVVPA